MPEKTHIDDLCEHIIGACIEVHKHLGPGLLETVYHEALKVEFGLRNLAYIHEYPIEGIFKGVPLGTVYRCDFLIAEQVLLEVKSIEQLKAIYVAVAINYATLAKKPTCLLINFMELKLVQGIKRVFPSRSFDAL